MLAEGSATKYRVDEQMFPHAPKPVSFAASFDSHAAPKRSVSFGLGTPPQASSSSASASTGSILAIPKGKPKGAPAGIGYQAYVWFEPWSSLAFHTSVRLAQGGEGLLIDSGAIGNLSGSAWVKRTSSAAASAGHGTSYEALAKPLEVGGVGKTSQKVVDKASVPVAFENGAHSVFETPVVPDSELPALLGLQLLEGHKMLLDCHHRKLIIPGPGGYRLHLSPGSISLNLRKAQSGHLLLPCTAWKSLKQQSPFIMRPLHEDDE